MYGQRDYHAKCSQTEKEKYHMISTDNVESKKKKTYLQNRKKFTDSKATYGYQRG